MPGVGPESINLDYRIVALLLAMATRSDLLETYINGKGNLDETNWKDLLALGFPIEMLRDHLFVFEATQDCLKQTQTAMATLVNLNDYCKLGCPSDPILKQITSFTTGLMRPLAAPGKPN